MTPAFILLVAKGGPKLTESEAGQQNCAPQRGTNGLLHFTCQHVAAADLPKLLTGLGGGYLTGASVVDQTGLTGSWDFKLEWSQWEQYSTSSGAVAAGTPSATPAVSLFDAVESQLGLRLESKKLQLPVLVIDHVDRVPAKN